MHRFVFLPAEISDDGVKFLGELTQIRITGGALMNPTHIGPHKVVSLREIRPIIEGLTSGDLLLLYLGPEHENVDLSGHCSILPPVVNRGSLHAHGKSLVVALAPDGFVWVPYLEKSWLINWSGKGNPSVEFAEAPPSRSRVT